MIIFAVIFTLLLGICIFLGVPRVRKWQQVSSVLIFVLLTGVVYAGSVDLLGAPKPLRLEWRSPMDATVLAARMREGQAIYVWLQSRDATAPRAYVLPWNTEAAKQLHEALQDGESTGSQVRMSLSSASGGGDGNPKFYADPQRPLPDKNSPGGEAVRYRHPDS